MNKFLWFGAFVCALWLGWLGAAALQKTILEVPADATYLIVVGLLGAKTLWCFIEEKE